MQTLNETEHGSRLQRGVVRVRSNGKPNYAEAFKAELVRQCLVPGTSVAAAGLAHGINANRLRCRIALHSVYAPSSSQPALLPVTVHRSSVACPAASTPAVPEAAQAIEIEFHGARVHSRGSLRLRWYGWEGAVPFAIQDGIAGRCAPRRVRIGKRVRQNNAGKIQLSKKAPPTPVGIVPMSGK